MLRVIALLIFSLLLMSPNGFCAQSNEAANSSNYDYNFDENSFNISDEQFKEVEEVEQKNEKQTFTSKVINSSHFSPNTATRTWIPFRKNN